MIAWKRLSSKEVALAVTFAALYVVFGFIRISPILGLSGQAITAAAIIAPIIGAILGVYIGTLSVTVGGLIGLFMGSFSPPSFASGIFAALCAGLLYQGKRIACALVYIALLLVFGFYPIIGPAWLYPLSMWFQIAGLIVLASPLESLAVKSLHSNAISEFLFAFFVVALPATLAGQLAGSIVFELTTVNLLETWTVLWASLAFLYPLERTVIAVGSALVGAPLLKVLRSTGFLRVANRGNEKEKCS